MGGYEARFRAFHKANPHVYRELLRLARIARRNRKKVGIRMLWEVMRWNLTIVTHDDFSNFKLNDHYHSRYARLLNREPELLGVFELRQLRTQ